MEEKEQWMNKLKEKLENYSEPLPASGWERLEKELMPPVERRIYPYRRWMTAAAAVVVLALVTSVSLYFLGTPAADEIRYTQTPSIASLPDDLPAAQQPDEQVTVPEPVLRRSVVKSDRLAQAEVTPVKESSPVADVEEEASPVAGAEEKQEPETRETAPVVSRRPSGRDKYHLPVKKTPSQKGTWSMGLSVGNSGGASTELKGGAPYMSRVSMAAVSSGLLNISSDQTVVFEDGIPYLREAKKVVDVKHHQPISVGVSVRKSLGKGFSLESGLTYTLLSSDARLANSSQEVEQKLHYLGIPLKANWNFLDKKLLTLYVSGGGMIEKCVYGKLGTEKETVKPLQFSVSGAVGAQVNATEHIGIYVEPGVAYFFDDGSDVQTIRKENPFNFNMQAGIRFTY